MVRRLSDLTVILEKHTLIWKITCSHKIGIDALTGDTSPLGLPPVKVKIEQIRTVKWPYSLLTKVLHRQVRAAGMTIDKTA